MLNKFLNFDEMITPAIIKIIYWVCAALSIIGGLVSIIQGITNRFNGGLQVVVGFFVIILGPLFVRIGCELLIVQFEIHKNLVDINRKTQ